MLTKSELSLKSLRRNHAQANSQQSRMGQRHVERPQNVMFRRVAL